MSHSAISVENLSKAYRIGLKEEAPDTLAGAVAGWVKAPLRNLRRLRRLDTSAAPMTADADDTLWALRDVSFEVPEGEVLGVIGRNGAGKSTLLKILSRITEPTSGRIRIRGRVSSLLEVGTGFHPELTGRENVYMNGTILGMRKREIDRKFDEIIAFSGVEKFLDTPIKRYSSGMTVRLAFAVAAHLEPEILIVDEVLAVGDASFQQQCLRKMQSVSRGGRTVLFVSHNITAIEALCQSSLLLSKGKVKSHGPTSRVVREYRQDAFAGMVDQSAALSGRGLLQRIRLLDSDDAAINFLTAGSDLTVELAFGARCPILAPNISIGFDDALMQRILTICTAKSRIDIAQLTGDTIVRCRIPTLPLAPGDYTLTVGVAKGGESHEYCERATSLRVIDGDMFGEGRGFVQGLCVAPSNWSLSRETSCPVAFVPSRECTLAASTSRQND